jgi:hypothetical protein
MADRVVLDASAGVEILNRSFAGVQLAKTLEPPGVQVWTVEHFHLEVAKVFRRDVISGDIADAEATELVVSLAAWPLYVGGRCRSGLSGAENRRSRSVWVAFSVRPVAAPRAVGRSWPASAGTGGDAVPAP